MRKLTFNGTIKTESDFSFAPPGVGFYVNRAIKTTNEIRTATADGMRPHMSGNALRGVLRNEASQVLFEGLPGGCLSVDDLFITAQGGKPAKAKKDKEGGFAKITATSNPVVRLFGAISDGPMPIASKLQVEQALFGEGVSDEDARKAALQNQNLPNLKFTSLVRFPLNRRVRGEDPDYSPLVEGDQLDEFEELVEIGKKSDARRAIDQDENLNEDMKKAKKKEQDKDALHNQVIVRSMAIPQGNTADHRIMVKNPEDVETGLLLHAMERFSINPQVGAHSRLGMGRVSMDYVVTVVENGKRVGKQESVTIGCDADGVSLFKIKGDYLKRCYAAFTEFKGAALDGDIESLKVDLK